MAKRVLVPLDESIAAEGVLSSVAEQVLRKASAAVMLCRGGRERAA